MPPRGQHFALFGNVAMQREYCVHCKQYTFVSDGKLACCGSPTEFDSNRTKRMSEAQDVRRRTEYLAGESCVSLIPYRMAACGSSGEWDAEVLGPWPSSALRKLKADLQERSGVRFRGWKAMRAT